jgi:hypothetical protein
MPRLSVVAGPSLDALVPISVNSGIPHNIVSDAFEGQILAYIKGFPDEEGNVESEYFQREDRKSITWSIQTQGTSLDLESLSPIPLCQLPRNDNDNRALGLWYMQDVFFTPSRRMTCSSVTRSTVR